MWGLSRRALDALLLEAAMDAGVRVLQPARCEALEVAPDAASRQAAGAAQRSPGSFPRQTQDPGLRFAPHPAWRLRLRDLDTNAVATTNASYVILADGKAAFAKDSPEPTGDFGIKAHFENVDGPRDAIELFAVRETYGGLAAIEDGLWNVAFSVPADRMKSCRGDFNGLLEDWLSENKTFADRMRHARRVGRWFASSLPRFAVRIHWQPGVIPIGNAAAAVEPIGGEGMGLAMRSAELAADALLTSTTHELPELYADLWRTRRFGCRAAALAVSNAPLADMVARHGVPQFLMRAAFGLIGK
jgi:flavin-dependent dehydrogenase